MSPMSSIRRCRGPFDGFQVEGFQPYISNKEVDEAAGPPFLTTGDPRLASYRVRCLPASAFDTIGCRVGAEHRPGRIPGRLRRLPGD
jgi:hypothetical protein